MFDQTKFQTILNAYKQVFLKQQWPDEKYKWIAVKHFQDHWDIEAADFLAMFLDATQKTDNLLTAFRYYPQGMIKEFAQADPEATRAMFISLFDESKDLYERIVRFIADSDSLREKYDPGSWNQHYQNMNSITTYLWLRYPDRYYIYKYSELRNIAKSLESNFLPTKGTRAGNISGFHKLYDTLRTLISEDTELTGMLQSALTPDCYPDKRHNTLTIDFGYFTSRTYKKDVSNESDWFPPNYHPGLTIDDWIELLKDSEVFNKNALTIVSRLKDFGGSATCTQLATKYGENINFYNAGSTHLAKRIHKKRNVPLFQGDNENAKWWPILYTGKPTTNKEDGFYVWKLRDELSNALEQLGISELIGNDTTKEMVNISYWWLNANPRIWSFSALAVGESDFYTIRNQTGNFRRIHQNFLNAKAEDFVICYESSPAQQIVALAKVTEDTDEEKLYFEKTEVLPNPIPLSAIKQLPELANMEYLLNPNGSLFRLSKDEFEVLLDVVREQNPGPNNNNKHSIYQKSDFLSEVFLDEEQYDTLELLIQNKKNVILQGAPGTGKTFASKRLAYAIMGEKNDDRVEMVQFHQNYSYEDFVMGYRPTEDGFELKHGIFYRFCIRAANEPGKKFFLIIDEINRGNLSKIFGELLMLIENDYRGSKLTLPYSGQSFNVPENLYIIGLMNTADRSLALIDYALRRRFSFFDMEPAFNRSSFRKYQNGLKNETFDELITEIGELNREIIADKSLGKGFRIGHSYFCNKTECTDEWMRQVIDYEILPMLREYWFDEELKLRSWENRLNNILNDSR